MEEKTQKTAFYVFFGIAVVGFVISIVALCIFSIGFKIGLNQTTSEPATELFSKTYGLFSFKDEIAKAFTAMLPDYDGSSYGSSFAYISTEIKNVSTTGITVAMILILIGGAAVAAGLAVRIFAKKRKLSIAISCVGFASVLVGAIIFVIMLTNMNGDIQEVFRLGLSKIYGSDKDAYQKALDNFSIHTSATNTSALMPLIGAGVTAIISVVPMFKPFKTTEF